MSAWLQNLFTLERLLIAATAGSCASLVLRAHDALFPGPPQSTIMASKHVPFFQHMILSGYVTVLAWVGGGRAALWAERRPVWLAVGIMLTTLGTAILQWFFPNY